MIHGKLAFLSPNIPRLYPTARLCKYMKTNNLEKKWDRGISGIGKKTKTPPPIGQGTHGKKATPPYYPPYPPIPPHNINNVNTTTYRRWTGDKSGIERGIRVPDVNADLLLVQYLVLACAYYHFHESLTTDAQFDRVARELARRWDEVTHPHRELVDIETLRNGGSGFYIKWPLRVIGATAYRIGQHYKRKLD